MDAPKLASDRTLCHDCNHEATEIAPGALFDLAGESQAEPRPRSPRPPDLSRAQITARRLWQSAGRQYQHRGLFRPNSYSGEGW
jgi:hypothetical protein